MKCEHGVHPRSCPVLDCVDRQISDLASNDEMWPEDVQDFIHKRLNAIPQRDDVGPSDRHLFILECEMIVDDCFNILDRLDDIGDTLDKMP